MSEAIYCGRCGQRNDGIPHFTSRTGKHYCFSPFYRELFEQMPDEAVQFFATDYVQRARFYRCIAQGDFRATVLKTLVAQPDTSWLKQFE